jgi:ribonuclease/clavin/mitogillin
MNIVNVGYDSTNYYIVEQATQRLLVDVGFPGTLPKLLAMLKRKGIALQQINYLFATHYHPDHAGLVQELKHKGVQHIVLEEQCAAVPTLRTYVKPDSGYQEIRLHDSICFPASQSRAWLASIGLSGEMVPTPGHSDDSVTLVLAEGLAFTGDLPRPGMVAEPAAQILEQSWQKLRRLKVSKLYPGHGPAGLPFV